MTTELEIQLPGGVQEVERIFLHYDDCGFSLTWIAVTEEQINILCKHTQKLQVFIISAAMNRPDSLQPHILTSVWPLHAGKEKLVFTLNERMNSECESLISGRETEMYRHEAGLLLFSFSMTHPHLEVIKVTTPRLSVSVNGPNPSVCVCLWCR